MAAIIQKGGFHILAPNCLGIAVGGCCLQTNEVNVPAASFADMFDGVDVDWFSAFLVVQFYRCSIGKDGSHKQSLDAGWQFYLC